MYKCFFIGGIFEYSEIPFGDTCVLNSESLISCFNAVSFCCCQLQSDAHTQTIDVHCIYCEKRPTCPPEGTASVHLIVYMFLDSCIILVLRSIYLLSSLFFLLVYYTQFSSVLKCYCLFNSLIRTCRHTWSSALTFSNSNVSKCACLTFDFVTPLKYLCLPARLRVAGKCE